VSLPIRHSLFNSLQLILVGPITLIVLLTVTAMDILVNEKIIIGGNVPHLIGFWYSAFAVAQFGLVALVLIFIFLLSHSFRSVLVWGLTLWLPLVTGTEDIFYYFLQRMSLPATFEWLNNSPLISWTRYVTNTTDIVRNGVYLSAAVGWLVILFVWCVFGILTFKNLRRTATMV